MCSEIDAPTDQCAHGQVCSRTPVSTDRCSHEPIIVRIRFGQYGLIRVQLGLRLVMAGLGLVRERLGLGLVRVRSGLLELVCRGLVGLGQGQGYQLELVRGHIGLQAYRRVFVSGEYISKTTTITKLPTLPSKRPPKTVDVSKVSVFKKYHDAFGEGFLFESVKSGQHVSVGEVVS